MKEQSEHDNHKPDFPKCEVQISSEIHQANRELAEQKLADLLKDLAALLEKHK